MEIRSRQEKTHTPGPWELEFDESGFYVGNPGQMVARIYPVVPMRWVGDKLTHEAANAHLIAAAPDMAEALRFMVEAAKTEPGMNIYKAHMDKAVKALKKAGV